MRLKASLGCALLALLAACETIPESVKVDIDGSTLELKRKPAAAEPTSGERR